MSSKDIFENLAIGPEALISLGRATWLEFTNRVKSAAEKGECMEAANAGMNLGIEIGIALCRDAAQKDSQWILKSKDEWERHYRRPNGSKPHWRTIRQYVRWKQVSKYSKYAHVHVDDLDKEL